MYLIYVNLIKNNVISLIKMYEVNEIDIFVLLIMFSFINLLDLLNKN